jgi:hypothetical protein
LRALAAAGVPGKMTLAEAVVKYGPIFIVYQGCLWAVMAAGIYAVGPDRHPPLAVYDS